MGLDIQTKLLKEDLHYQPRFIRCIDKFRNISNAIFTFKKNDVYSFLGRLLSGIQIDKGNVYL